jgi:hypothetical protein
MRQNIKKGTEKGLRENCVRKAKNANAGTGTGAGARRGDGDMPRHYSFSLFYRSAAYSGTDGRDMTRSPM